MHNDTKLEKGETNSNSCYIHLGKNTIEKSTNQSLLTIPRPTIYGYISGQTGFYCLGWQPVWEKENSQIQIGMKMKSSNDKDTENINNMRSPFVRKEPVAWT